MNLTITRNEADSVFVKVAGPITSKEAGHAVDPLLQLLGEDGARKQVRLEMSEATLLDSSGVNWLLKCHKQLKQAGGKLVLVRPSTIVANVLKLLKMDKIFELDTSPGVAG